MRQITEVKEIQKILFDNLVFLKTVCEKHHLTFYLSNGTLLGAVKYQKFIPWDDDADVFMPRKDYDKLMKLTEWDDCHQYELLSKDRDVRWRMPYAKLRNKKTLQQETTADFGMENGVAVDIFPLDNWCGSEKDAIKQAKACGLLRRFLTASIETNFFSPRKGIKRVILYLIWKYSHIRGNEVFYKKIMKQIEKGIQCSSVEYKGCVSWSLYGKKEVVPAHVFEKTVDVMFEGEVFPAPVGYDLYLKQLYGDYSQEPPKELQKSHHDIRAWWKNEC